MIIRVMRCLVFIGDSVTSLMMFVVVLFGGRGWQICSFYYQNNIKNTFSHPWPLVIHEFISIITMPYLIDLSRILHQHFHSE